MTETEAWRPIAEFDGLYLISSKGRVKSVKASNRRDRGDGKILTSFVAGHTGYYKLVLTVGKIRKNRAIHRMVADAFIENPLSLKQVNHIDGNKANNSVENLEWSTCRDNNLHACRVLLKKVRPVVASSLSGDVSFYFPSLRHAVLCGYTIFAIDRSIDGKRVNYQGFRWSDAAPRTRKRRHTTASAATSIARTA